MFWQFLRKKWQKYFQRIIICGKIEGQRSLIKVVRYNIRRIFYEFIKVVVITIHDFICFHNVYSLFITLLITCKFGIVIQLEASCDTFLESAQQGRLPCTVERVYLATLYIYIRGLPKRQNCTWWFKTLYLWVNCVVNEIALFSLSIISV